LDDGLVTARTSLAIPATFDLRHWVSGGRQKHIYLESPPGQPPDAVSQGLPICRCDTERRTQTAVTAHP
jgi:hypothetical protein